jgi:hypothetical protein
MFGCGASRFRRTPVRYGLSSNDRRLALDDARCPERASDPLEGQVPRFGRRSDARLVIRYECLFMPRRYLAAPKPLAVVEAKIETATFDHDLVVPTLSLARHDGDSVQPNSLRCQLFGQTFRKKFRDRRHGSMTANCLPGSKHGDNRQPSAERRLRRDVTSLGHFPGGVIRVRPASRGVARRRIVGLAAPWTPMIN